MTHGTVTDKKIIELDQVKVACRHCALNELCLPMGLDRGDMEQLDAIVRRNQPLHRGDHLFRYGDRFNSLYVVKTGSLKLYTHRPDGGEQVIGFHLPGEIIGLEAIDSRYYGYNARALETAAVCELPFEVLEQLTVKLPKLQNHMYRLMSKEITKETKLLILLGKSTAEERLAAFLVSLSCRFYHRGFSSMEYFLSMSRQEIGSYLGLALETISRLFTQFQEQGILDVDRKHVRILDMERLQAIISTPTECDHKTKIPR